MLRIYVGANVVFKSMDEGQTWTQISDDLTNDYGLSESQQTQMSTLVTVGSSGVIKADMKMNMQNWMRGHNQIGLKQRAMCM